MPELPEVEQVRRSLLPHIKNERICKVGGRGSVYCPRCQK